MLFKVKKKKLYGKDPKELIVYAVDKSKTPRFLIYNEEKEEFEWVWSSLYEPVVE